jgi:RNA polymerase-binding transcription factor DksA
MRREGDGRSSPRWRAILEARWRARLEEVTELSLAYHAAAADILAGVEDTKARLLLHRSIEARQRLADTEDALGKMATGDFGRCEECGAYIAGLHLAAAPESRYCADCAGDIAAGDIAGGDAVVVEIVADEATTGWARAGLPGVGTAAGRR